MNAAAQRELSLRVSDLENALKAIGRIAVDATITPKARLQRISGILSMYDAALPLISPIPTTPLTPEGEGGR